MSDALLIAELRRDEGERLKPYMDTASPPRLTIGCGRNLTDVGISPEESAFMLENDIARVRAGLDARLPWWRDLDAVRMRVFVNLAFNLGINGLLNFRKFLAHAKAGRWERAAAELLDSRWAVQVKDRATRLAHMIATGETPTTSSAANLPLKANRPPPAEKDTI